MKRIRLYLLALVVSVGGVSYGATNDYSAALHSLQQALDSVDDAVWNSYDLWLEIGTIIDSMSSAIIGGKLPDNTYWTNLGNAIIRLRDNVISLESLIAAYIPYLDSITYYAADINILLSSIYGDLSELNGLADALQNIISYASDISDDMHQTMMNTDGVATEGTLYQLYLKVQEIHGMLQSIDPTSILTETQQHWKGGSK